MLILLHTMNVGQYNFKIRCEYISERMQFIRDCLFQPKKMIIQVI